MTLLAAIAIAALSLLNYRLARSMFYPPFLFCSWWVVLLSSAGASEHRFGALSAHSIFLYVLGTFAFTAGGLVALVLRSSTRKQEVGSDAGLKHYSHCLRWILIIGFVVLLAAWPLYWQYLRTIASSFQSPDFWWAMRAGTIARGEVQGIKSLESIIFDNLALVAVFLALTAATHCGEAGIRKRHLLTAVVIAVAFNLATASRSGAALTIIGVSGIIAIRQRSIKWSHIAFALMGFGLVYSSMAVLLKKGGNVDLDIFDNVKSLADSLILYEAGPLIAFSNYVADPSVVAATWSPTRAVFQIADRFGIDVGSIPSLHTGYTTVGTDQMINVYTMYFSYYPDFGDVGVFVCTLLVGYFSAAVYLGVRRKGRGFVLLYGIVVFEILMSGFNEGFLLGLNMWFKAALYIGSIYYAIPFALSIWRQHGHRSTSIVQTGPRFRSVERSVAVRHLSPK